MKDGWMEAKEYYACPDTCRLLACLLHGFELVGFACRRFFEAAGDRRRSTDYSVPPIREQEGNKPNKRQNTRLLKPAKKFEEADKERKTETEIVDVTWHERRA